MANNTDANAGPNSSLSAQLGIKPWLLVVPLLLIALFFLPSAAVIGVGMIPTVVARVVDSSPGRRLTVTVGAMNLIGSLYFLHRIWAEGHDISDIGLVLRDSYGWLCALAGAGMGWIIFGAMPTIIAQFARAQTAVRLHRVTGDQDRLVKEWGESVRGIHAAHVDVDAEGQ